MTWDLFLPEHMKPAQFRINGMLWDAKVFAALDILSSFTHGQATRVNDFLEDAVEKRVQGSEESQVIVMRDVFEAITTIFERAGFVAQRVSTSAMCTR